MGAADRVVTTQAFRLAHAGEPTLALRVQRAAATAQGDAVYVHGGTFGAALSVFHRLDGRSWADSMNAVGIAVWGFDFAGYGDSDRYAGDAARPAGRMDDVIPQLRRVLAAVRSFNGDRPVALIAHSWGAAVAARYAGLHPEDVKALVLFAPIVTRPSAGPGASPATPPSHYSLTRLAQYRRFVEDVPRGQPQMLSEAHFETWSEAFLASDPHCGTSVPPAVRTPFGPVADIGAMWSGRALYDASRITAPTLVVRGEWDSLCTDADARRLLDALGSEVKLDAPIERATHLMHLEAQRTALHDRVNDFLLATSARRRTAPGYTPARPAARSACR
jgi:alpha-beta hydrolase superfamily lysophospholipase